MKTRTLAPGLAVPVTLDCIALAMTGGVIPPLGRFGSAPLARPRLMKPLLPSPRFRATSLSVDSGRTRAIAVWVLPEIRFSEAAVSPPILLPSAAP